MMNDESPEVTDDWIMSTEADAMSQGSQKYDNLRTRTKAFALAVIRFTRALPKTREGDVLGKQLLRSGTSVGANYRAAFRARSQADFISKMGVVEEEADESAYWMELLVDGGIVSREQVRDLLKEADELVAIAAASIKTARQNQAKR